eukprot:TRINITY_DN10953_c0_g1_i1.p3 TRINITY_DN10953_c0_g1~~TRINITY_DN10953_c0_g1_i1.p3  ORF type:complete len:112 (+),score=14.85 TRINITY_DN10953_c0_g1_i1:196-531(+)
MSEAAGTSNSNANPAEAKPKVNGSEGGEDATITLKVIGQDRQEIVFKVKFTTPFKKLFTAYCQRVSQDPGVVRFIFDGERISDTDTPSSLNMQNNDIIEVLIEQQGGCIEF